MTTYQTELPGIGRPSPEPKVKIVKPESQHEGIRNEGVKNWILRLFK